MDSDQSNVSIIDSLLREIDIETRAFMQDDENETNEQSQVHHNCNNGQTHKEDKPYLQPPESTATNNIPPTLPEANNNYGQTHKEDKPYLQPPENTATNNIPSPLPETEIPPINILKVEDLQVTNTIIDPPLQHTAEIPENDPSTTSSTLSESTGSIEEAKLEDSDTESSDDEQESGEENQETGTNNNETNNSDITVTISIPENIPEEKPSTPSNVEETNKEDVQNQNIGWKSYLLKTFES